MVNQARNAYGAASEHAHVYNIATPPQLQLNTVLISRVILRALFQLITTTNNAESHKQGRYMRGSQADIRSPRLCTLGVHPPMKFLWSQKETAFELDETRQI